MQTLKKFIKYYKPYKAVFFIDLLCATIISAIDLAFPQLLRTLTKTLFAGAPGKIISALIPITIGLLVAYIIRDDLVTGVQTCALPIYMKSFLFRIMIRIIRDR